MKIVQNMRSLENMFILDIKLWLEGDKKSKTNQVLKNKLKILCGRDR